MDRRLDMRFTAMFSVLALTLGSAACGDDDGGASDDASAASSSTGSPSASAGPGTLGEGDSTTEAADDDTTSDDGVVTDTDTDTGEATDTEGSTDTGTPVERDWGALVLGTLYTDDITEAQGTHDAVAMGGQRGAMMAGDFGHDALLGTTLLGTTENQFLGIDQWDNLDGALMVYGDPMFQAAFGMLFAEPPSLELFERRDDWHGWGSLEAADGGEHWYVVVRGTLSGDDLDASQTLHDMVAMGGQEAAVALGDVAHVVWVGTPEDPSQFFAVDVWNDDAMLEAFYSNPAFLKAFGALFEEPPTIGVYGSADWHQW
ncbi:MAG: hypothetical protein JKY37_23995 [Nannocystaceae bacterium]|nr:hypothetical protein [Nannocystaceae bacterium]